MIATKEECRHAYERLCDQIERCSMGIETSPDALELVAGFLARAESRLPSQASVDAERARRAARRSDDGSHT